ncbi:hypothetical protein B0H34DRAFT_738827 [Crassisporium funariophilum]|nr:hypothetical protein B0H34DRAFT_738827 [Crassisporium funariophilum]
MIILTLLYAFSRSTRVHSLPIYSRDSESTFGDRSIWNIIWSCLATIFACTWVSTHPNVPAPSDSQWKELGRRLKIMAFALIAPEVVFIWATRQYFGASEIAKRHRKRGWTKAYGFFVSMGGFSLHQDGRMIRPLDILELEELEAAGKVEWPIITEDEIKDRSKGDFFTKGVVVLQTSWFIAQCISRGVNHLIVTELEIVTLAFAVLNGGLYFLWWNKPLDVRCTVPVHLIGVQLPESAGETVRSELDKDSPAVIADETTKLMDHDLDNRKVSVDFVEVVEDDAGPGNVSTMDEGRQLSISTHDSIEVGQDHDDSDLPTSSIDKAPNEPESAPQLALESTSTEDTPEVPSTLIITSLPPATPKAAPLGLRASIYDRAHRRGVMWTAFYYFFRPVVSTAVSFNDMLFSETLEEGSQRVPTFYSPKLGDSYDGLPIMLGLSVAIVFGGIHCIAWSFAFISTAEKMTWRVSAVVIFAYPVAMAILTTILDSCEEEGAPVWVRYTGDAITGVLVLISAAYVCSRFVLLVLPLMALRALPAGAYIDLDWTAFLPHI